MPDKVTITLEIRDCRDCPFYSRWVRGGFWNNRCRKEDKWITEIDGVKPPPDWCPLRSEVRRRKESEIRRREKARQP